MTKSIDEILAVAADPAYHRVVTARISLVPQALRDEHAELEALLPTLLSDTIDAHPQAHATAERLAAIEAEMAENSIEFKFRSIGHRAWADLLRRHPPTRAQLTASRQLDHNPESFPYDAMAASCVEPVMTVEQVQALERTPAVDVELWSTLWSACLQANVSAAAPKSLAASILLRSDEFSRRHTTTESLEVGSSDE